MLGGGTSSVVYDKRRGDPPPCLAVVDGDHTYPGGPPGDVARDVAGRRRCEPSSSMVASARPGCRKPLPHALIDEIADGDPSVAATLLQHEALQSSPLSELLDICDLRGGTPYFEVFNTHSNLARNTYWNTLLPQIQVSDIIPPPREESADGCPGANGNPAVARW